MPVCGRMTRPILRASRYLERLISHQLSRLVLWLRLGESRPPLFGWRADPPPSIGTPPRITCWGIQCFTVFLPVGESWLRLTDLRRLATRTTPRPVFITELLVSLLLSEFGDFVRGGAHPVRKGSPKRKCPRPENPCYYSVE